MKTTFIVTVIKVVQIRTHKYYVSVTQSLFYKATKFFVEPKSILKFEIFLHFSGFGAVDCS